jgi:hypothetical protein
LEVHLMSEGVNIKVHDRVSCPVVYLTKPSSSVGVSSQFGQT